MRFYKQKRSLDALHFTLLAQDENGQVFAYSQKENVWLGIEGNDLFAGASGIIAIAPKTAQGSMAQIWVEEPQRLPDAPKRTNMDMGLGDAL